MGDPLSEPHGLRPSDSADPLASSPEERKAAPKHIITTVHANSTDPLSRTQVAERAQQKIKEQHAAGRLPPPSSVPQVQSDGKTKKVYDITHLGIQPMDTPYPLGVDTLDSLKDLYAKGTIEIDELETRTAAVLAALPKET